MDLTAPARDIEELVAAFAEMQGTELAQMKELWRARNFSFIHEARPKDVSSSFYAQGLFSSALIHVVGDGSLNWKVGALYVLYTLHGTQLQESCCRIYLSLEELEALHSLVKEIKKKGLTTALVVLRKMFAENMFLFGSVSANQKRIATTVARLVKQANTRVHQARFRLLTNVPMQQHLTAHLGQELGLDELVQLTEEYAAAKRRALCEDGDEGGEIAVEGAQPALGAELLKDANSWDVQKVELVTPSQPRSNQAPLSANGTRVGSARRKRKSSREPRKKTITEYERELRERSKMSEFERELVAQLDLALDNLD
ncbi:unnamed protein product [Calypogeia fissa]